ncbi:hypothetical protein BURKHO8Y_110312 [Burkholderia sp. 8Y]|nr:hypothetical protein BURKHO8Y_110312 [Burkholderia sp. 8Y]
MRRQQFNRNQPHQRRTIMSLQAILAGTPVWVWVLLAVLVSRGIKAMKGGTAPLSKLAVVPAIFAAWGLLHIVSGPSTGWQAAAMWLVGACSAWEPAPCWRRTAPSRWIACSGPSPCPAPSCRCC